MIEFKRQSQSTKNKAWNRKKFPRHILKNEDCGDRDIIAYGHYKNNWSDESYLLRNRNIFYKKMSKFLRNNIGKDVDDVFYKFIKRCNKNTRGCDVKKEYYSYFEEHSNWSSGFYLEDNIIRSQEKPKRRDNEYGTYKENYISSLNNDKKVIKVCENSSHRTVPQFLGWELCSNVYGEHRSEYKNNINSYLPTHLPVYMIPYKDFNRNSGYNIVRLDNYISSVWVWKDKDNKTFIQYHKTIYHYNTPPSHIYSFTSGTQYVFITPCTYIEQILNNQID